MPRFVLYALAVTLLAPAARAQVEIRIGLPTVRFEVQPPVVMVEEGVQVVPDRDEEVFFVENAYWVRRENVWYRAPDHRGHWVVAEPRRVPVTLVRLPPGKYKRWHGRPVEVVKVKEVREKPGRREHGKHGRGHRD